MRVGDESDTGAVQSGSQAREPHVQFAYAGYATGLGVPPGEQYDGHTEDGPGHDAGPILSVPDAGHGQGRPQQDAEQNGPGEQDPAAAQQRVTCDRRPVLLAPAVAAHHRERHTDQTEDEQGGAGQGDGQRPVLPGVQQYPAGHGPQQDGCDQGDVAHQPVQSARSSRLRFIVCRAGVAGVGHAAPPDALSLESCLLRCRMTEGAVVAPETRPWLWRDPSLTPRFCCGLNCE